MNEQNLIRRAETHEADELSTLTLQSKAYWGYSPSQIEAWREDLCLSEEYLSKNEAFCLCHEKEIIGYYAYLQEGQNILLDNLFVHPSYIGQGYGRLLMSDFLERVQSSSAEIIRLESDPHAEGFYQRSGFQTIEHLATAIPGHTLALMQMAKV